MEKRLLLCRPDSSFPQDGCRAGRPAYRRLQQPDRFGEVQLLYKNINPMHSGEMIAGS
jgi:hypothetical protein